MNLRVVSILASLALVGCGTAEVDMPLDLDGDGLLSNTEVDIGTNPNEADSDGDGIDDGLEVESATDPLDSTDHPYLRGWPMDDCRFDEVEGVGNTPGQKAENFELIDQDGNPVRLYDFCAQAILLVSAADW